MRVIQPSCHPVLDPDGDLRRPECRRQPLIRRFDTCPKVDMTNEAGANPVKEFAYVVSAIGAEPRLRIMRLLLSAHPDGLVVREIGARLEIPGSTLSHHLERLKKADLVIVRREGTFLRHVANSDALRHLLAILYAECCSRNRVVEPDAITRVCEKS